MRREVIPRIRALARIRSLYAQLEPMKAIISQLKKEKDSAKKKHKKLEADMDETIAKIQVRSATTRAMCLGTLCTQYFYTYIYWHTCTCM